MSDICPGETISHLGNAIISTVFATDKVRNFISYRPIPSSKNPHFQNEARGTNFLVKMSFIGLRMKNDFLSKAEHLPSFWNRGPGELGTLTKKSIVFEHDTAK